MKTTDGPRNQVVATPREFIQAVERRFGEIEFDLAADAANRVGPHGRFYGPGSSHAVDALSVHWTIGGLAWLNPPFKRIAAFAEHCATEYRQCNGILLLGPAAVCTGWFVDHVAPHAYVFELTPRVFKTQIRDCFLAYYHPAGLTGRQTWRWKP